MAEKIKSDTEIIKELMEVLCVDDKMELVSGIKRLLEWINELVEFHG